MCQISKQHSFKVEATDARFLDEELEINYLEGYRHAPPCRSLASWGFKVSSGRQLRAFAVAHRLNQCKPVRENKNTTHLLFWIGVTQIYLLRQAWVELRHLTPLDLASSPCSYPRDLPLPNGRLHD